MESVKRVKARLGADRPSSPRFRVILASLIAITSLLAALGAWRAEDASNAGDDAERNGFADSVADQQEQARIRADIDDVVLTYYRAQSYFDQATALGAEAQRLGGPDGARLQAQATAHRRLGDRLVSRIDRDAIRPSGELDTDRKFDLDYALARNDRDLDPALEFADADRLKKKAERLVGLTALFVVAAFFFTLGQVSRRKTKLLYIAGGLSILLTASALLLAVTVVR